MIGGGPESTFNSRGGPGDLMIPVLKLLVRSFTECSG